MAKVIPAGHSIIVSNDYSPKVGSLSMQNAACSGAEAYPLDVLVAESEGMIGKLIEQGPWKQLTRYHC